MATRFTRVDLSEEARDFQPIAVEPGLPMLDRANANAKIVFKWLGRLAAEPVFQGNSVNFYVRDDRGGRLEDVAPVPATEDDLKGNLAPDLKTLKERMAAAAPETPTEKTLHKVLAESLEDLAENPNRTDRDNYFFRYRDISGKWRLAWCWGYQRVDQAPATPLVCTDPRCNLLFVRRPKASAKCPGCATAPPPPEPVRIARRRSVLVGLLLFLLGAALVYWWLYEPRLVATPEDWTGPVGGTVELSVDREGLIFRTDVTGKTVAEVGDPGVVRFDAADGVATAIKAGKTVITFRLGNLSTKVTLTVGAGLEPEPVDREDKALVVKIISDQGPSVQFPVGARFDDFRVEAEYKDGFTRLVTRKATLRTEQPAEGLGVRGQGLGKALIVPRPSSLAPSPSSLVIAPDGGKLIGVRPGVAIVHAEFDGVSSQQGLKVLVQEVLGELDVDEIRVTPSPVALLVGESIPMEAVGYKDGKSVGLITAMADLAWTADGEAITVNGPTLTARSIGSATVTARLNRQQVAGSRQQAEGRGIRGQGLGKSLIVPSPSSLVPSPSFLASEPARVDVVESIADPVVAQPEVIRMRQGESRRIGIDVAVFRGNVDFSSRCTVTPALPEVVAYNATSHALVGVSPGTSSVSLSVGGKLATVLVEVVGGKPLAGEIVVEPPASELSVPQAVPLRVFVITEDGQRIDQTESAVLSSSHPDQVRIVGTTAQAVSVGSAEITATLPGISLQRGTRGEGLGTRDEGFPQPLTPSPQPLVKPGKAYVVVNDGKIASLVVDPPLLDMSVGDQRRLRVFGRAPSGTYELLPPRGLKMTVGGPDPGAIRVSDDNEVSAVAPGRAVVEVTTGGLRQQVPVSAAERRITDLRIEPLRSSIHPGQAIVYRVTGIQGGLRRVLVAKDGVELQVADPEVAQVYRDLTVLGTQPGLTGIVGRLGDLCAEASLRVTPGGTPGTVWTVGPGGRIVESQVVYVSDVVSDVVDVPDVSQLWITPDGVSLQAGQVSPRFSVMARGADGTSHAVPGLLESMNEAVLSAAPKSPGRFVAGVPGGTKVRASYRGLAAFADVHVTGERFARVTSELNAGAPNAADFDVTIEVSAAAGEGPLEYRSYIAGATPTDTWIPAQADGNSQKAVLRSPRIAYGSRDALYELIIEARNRGGKTVQQYPFSFQIQQGIKVVP